MDKENKSVKDRLKDKLKDKLKDAKWITIKQPISTIRDGDEERPREERKDAKGYILRHLLIKKKGGEIIGGGKDLEGVKVSQLSDLNDKPKSEVADANAKSEVADTSSKPSKDTKDTKHTDHKISKESKDILKKIAKDGIDKVATKETVKKAQSIAKKKKNTTEECRKRYERYRDGYENINGFQHNYAMCEYKNNLERNSVYKYTESSTNINNALRKPSNSDAESTKLCIKRMDGLFKRAKTEEDMFVMRGVANNYADELCKMEIGTTYEDKGFTSTTTSLKTATAFSHSHTVIYIHVPKGSKAISVKDNSSYETEDEILLNRGSKFRVLNKVDNGETANVRYSLYVELI